MGIVEGKTCKEIRIFCFHRHTILNAIEKNHLIGARINIPLNLTYDEMLKVQRAPGSYWL